jgi:hypothetical protein
MLKNGEVSIVRVHNDDEFVPAKYRLLVAKKVNKDWVQFSNERILRVLQVN